MGPIIEHFKMADRESCTEAWPASMAYGMKSFKKV